MPRKRYKLHFSFRYLCLNRLAIQVVTHCSHAQLEGVADILWGPLFENSQNAEETTRNVAAALSEKAEARYNA